jgi:hypothetical protein
MHLLMKRSLVFLALALSGVVKAQTGIAGFYFINGLNGLGLRVIFFTKDTRQNN